jgi:hypothetical protein
MGNDYAADQYSQEATNRSLKYLPFRPNLDMPIWTL